VPRRLVAGRRVGDLESEVLEVLWSASGWLSGREVWERLGDGTDGTRAYTTVMTVLGRLVDKSLVERVEEGKGHLYRAAGDPDELTAQAIRSLLSATAHPRVALAHFVDDLDDPELVAELASALKRARRR
jgi:predicted transcriptional regulator